MSGLEEGVLRMLEREALIPPRGRVVVALSGGPDSVALTRLMRDLAPVAGFVLVATVHLNHHLRDAATLDEQFCRDLAERLSLPIEVDHADVRCRSRRDGISIEEAGHRERYEFFARALGRLRADRVATAHTRHDQAETFLMRLLRGAGPAGLSGIHPRSGAVIRPLLEVSREELRAYLAERGQTFRNDESNDDVGVTRNRIRHELIPFLERRFAPSVVEVLARDAKIARHDAEWLETQLSRVVSRIAKKTDDGTVSFRRRDLADQPAAMAGRLAKHALEQVAGTTAGFHQVERFLQLVVDERREAVVDFPGCRVSLEGDRVVVGPPRARKASPPVRFEYRLRIPGEVEVPEAGMAVSAARLAAGTPVEGLTAAGPCVYVKAEDVTSPLIVRSWQNGDRLKPLGLGGRKKVQDVFVDRKVNRRARQTVPIVADESRGIIWVVGHTMAEDFRVTSDAEGMLILKVRKLGGAG